MRVGVAKATILATALVAAAAASAQAAGLSLGGFAETTIGYTPENKWTGQTQLQIYASTGASNKASISLAWYDQTPLFWGSYGQLTLTPYAITLTANGPLWKRGPSLKTTLGNFDMSGPNYIAGDWARKQTLGIKFEDLKLGKATLGVFAGWPKYGGAPLDAGADYKSYGVSANIGSLYGIKLDAYANARSGHHLMTPDVIAPDGARYHFSVVNPTPSNTAGDQLNLFTRDATHSPYLQWWRYYLIGEDGTIQDIIYYPDEAHRPTKPSADTSYAFIIAAHGAAIDNFADPHLQATGEKVRFVVPGTDQALTPDQLQAVLYQEAVVALEASTKIAGFDINGQLGRQLISDADGLTKVSYGFQIAKASTSLDILGKELATKPLGLSMEYRNIDQDFLPWAAWQDNDGNRVYRQRGQQGVNFQASTTLVPVHPVDVTLSLDAYTNKTSGARSQSSSVQLSTKVASYSLTAAASNSESSVAITKDFANLAGGVVAKFTPTVKVTLPAAGAMKQEAGVAATLNLGGFEGISLGANYAVQGDSATTVASASYTAPNGLGFSAKWTKPDNTAKTDDTFAKVSYKVTF